jgi:hypothetical protein
MATIFYVRKGSQADRIASSREVSVKDVINLYGSEPANYMFMKGADSPTGNTGGGPAEFFSDPAHAVVKIDQAETDKETFPEDGFYIVKEARP